MREFVSIVSATSHQADFNKYGTNSGSQCYAMAFAACCYMFHTGCVEDWKTHTLDNILNCGNAIYSRVHVRPHQFLCSEELPRIVPELQVEVDFKIDCCLLDDTDEHSRLSLDYQLKSCLSQSSCCILCTRQIASAILKANGMYWIFDSHALNDHGMMHAGGTGKARLMKFKSYRALISYLRLRYGCEKYQADITTVTLKQFIGIHDGRLPIHSFSTRKRHIQKNSTSNYDIHMVLIKPFLVHCQSLSN